MDETKETRGQRARSKDDDDVQTNLLTALRENPDNLPVFNKLLAYMLALLFMPVATFFGIKLYIVDHIPVASKHHDMVAGVSAVFVLQVILFAYVFSAYSENNRAATAKHSKPFKQE